MQEAQNRQLTTTALHVYRVAGPRVLLTPGVQFVGRKGLKELRADLEFAFHKAWLTISFGIAKRGEYDLRIGSPSYDNILAAARFFDQPRKISLCFVYGYGFH